MTVFAMFKKGNDPFNSILWTFVGFTRDKADVQYEVDMGEVKAEDVRVFDFDNEGLMNSND